MRVLAYLGSFIILCLSAGPAPAGPTQFPYEAVVQRDGVLVRSGPGERYDATLKLDSGQQVTVHKHEPGGWFMIAPPPGSFSWIDSAYVEQSGPETGVVTVKSPGEGLPPRVAVWIGSQFSDEHRYYGRQLANGDEVHILGQKNVLSDAGQTTYFKIAPPRHEYRWVKGDFIVPTSDASRLIATTPGNNSIETPTISATPEQSDPFANSFSTQQTMKAPGFPAEQTSTLLERELSRGIDSGVLRSSTPPDPATTSQRAQLYDLDAQLKGMLAQTPYHWDLESMERAYRNLKTTSGPGVGSQIDMRLAAINNRKRIKAEYDAFLSVTSRTEQRDAELLSMQQNLTGVPLSPVNVDLGQATARPSQPAESPETSPSAPNSVDTTSVSQMDGAGVVQRLPHPRPGLPRHALVAPDGRVLAYLKPGQGVQLDHYLGQSMGVIGRRTFDPRLRNDLIVVERLTPVQLQQ